MNDLQRELFKQIKFLEVQAGAGVYHEAGGRKSYVAGMKKVTACVRSLRKFVREMGDV